MLCARVRQKYEINTPKEKPKSRIQYKTMARKLNVKCLISCGCERCACNTIQFKPPRQDVYEHYCNIIEIYF